MRLGPSCFSLKSRFIAGELGDGGNSLIYESARIRYSFKE